MVDSDHLPRDRPFDYQLAMDRLAAYRYPRNKLHQLRQAGEIIRVKKGLYIPSAPSTAAARVDPLVLAALIYGPSYVSLETALAHHGLIPERVNEITSMTTKRSRSFETPVGRYSYHSLNIRAYSYGVALEETTGGSYFLATPEKALCDRLAQIPGVRAQREIPALLEDDLRLELDVVMRLQASEVQEIAKRYLRNTVTAFAKWFQR
ncbi:MAG: hypothetical protein GWQ05_18070 [Verrucomicrobiaceae bacterium]|nr:hypothetical protein [Verrucomicrobiaceae bacterium]